MVRGIQPLVSYEGRLGLVLRPVVSGFCLVPSQQLHVLSSDDANRFSETGKRCGCTVSTMDLSEARGLVLFRVVRRGIGFTQRLGTIPAPCVYRR